MKHLRKFNTADEYAAFLEGGDVVYPNVSYIASEYSVRYNKLTPPLYVEALEDLTLSFSNAIQYSYDAKTWNELPANTASPVLAAGSVMYLQGKFTSANTYTGIGQFSMSGRCNVGGSVMSMLHGEDYLNKKDNLIYYAFSFLFENAPIVNAIDLVLPSKVLKKRCYGGMFHGCTSLVTAPELPATTLAEYCYAGAKKYSSYYMEYYGMFEGCTSLVNAPVLPADIATEGCYIRLFKDCTSLVNAPELPATTLAKFCYAGAFCGCTSLVNAPELPATTLAEACYGGFTSTNNGQKYGMFEGCTSLVNAPVLPATSLISGCYTNLFARCSSLKFIKAMFLDAPNTTNCYGWVMQVPSNGVFVKNAAATWEDTFDTSAIPTGWTVELADA